MRLPLIIFQIWMWGVPIWGLCALAYLLFTVLRDASKVKERPSCRFRKKRIAIHRPVRLGFSASCTDRPGRVRALACGCSDFVLLRRSLGGAIYKE